MINSNKHIAWLFNTDDKAINLALLRVGICCWLLCRILMVSADFNLVYSAEALSNSNQKLLVQINYSYVYFFTAFVVLIFLYLFGIGKNIVAFLVFMFYHYFNQMNIGIANGGDNITKYVLLYLSFANTYKYLCLRKKSVFDAGNNIQNGLNNLVYLSIVLQLCLVYLSTAIIKLLNNDWTNGDAIYYALQSERYGGEFMVKDYLHNTILIKSITYFTIVFELAFPFLIWIKKCRKLMIVAGLALHIGIGIFMMLYSFQIMFIMLYTIFIPNKWLEKFFTKNYK
jgi:hypothetical protein